MQAPTNQITPHGYKKPRTRRASMIWARVFACVALGFVAALLIVRRLGPLALHPLALQPLALQPLALHPLMQSPLVARVLPPLPSRMTRPWGMAPQAFDGFIRACARCGINPNRIGQTIGEHPLSVGYHKRDGVLIARGEQMDYCAATDSGFWGMTPLQIARFCVALQRQGFAPFYRHGGQWKGGEHIHAIYALLPMKPQLRGQVREFLSKRRDDGFSRLKWEKKLRRRYTNPERERRADVPQD